MGIVTGYIGLLCFCILCARALTHKFHFLKMDHIIMRLHQPVCVLFLAVCMLHILFVYPVLKARHILVPVTGIWIIVIFVLLTALCHILKAKKLNLTLHCVLSIVMLCSIMGHIWVYFADYQNYQAKIQAIQIGDVSLAGLRDGIYTGDCDAGYIYARVEVTVRDGQIICVNLLQHDNERGALAEKITEQIVTEQRLTVDAVSGATNSSLVIKKAIENALSSTQTAKTEPFRRVSQ